MSGVFEFMAESRSTVGTSAAKVVRRQGRVPAVIYGGDKSPEMLSLDHNEVLKHLAHEAVYSHVLEVKVSGLTEKAVLKHIQRHPAKPQILHIDFLRVDDSHKLRVHVPLHFKNEDTCAGVKKGGVVTHSMVDVVVSCMPSMLPEFIEVDLASIDIGGIVHLSDLVLPPGVEIPELSQGQEHDHPVVQVIKTRSGDNSAD